MGGTTKYYFGNIGSSLKIMQSFCYLYSQDLAQITIPTRVAGHIEVVRLQLLFWGFGGAGCRFGVRGLLKGFA